MNYLIITKNDTDVDFNNKIILSFYAKANVNNNIYDSKNKDDNTDNKRVYIT